MQFSKNEEMALLQLPNILAIAKITETNRKQILGATETYTPKESGGTTTKAPEYRVLTKEDIEEIKAKRE